VSALPDGAETDQPIDIDDADAGGSGGFPEGYRLATVDRRHIAAWRY
jgi:hypothetical protein